MGFEVLAKEGSVQPKSTLPSHTFSGHLYHGHSRPDFQP